MFIQMLIGEILDRERMEELKLAFSGDLLPALMREPGVRTAGLIIEDGESVMVVILISWCTRDAAIAWMNGDRYRAFRSVTQPALQGQLVVKLFRVHSTATK